MHIGCNNYSEIKGDSEFKSVYESHNDVTSYEEFFKNELHFHKIYKIVDNSISEMYKRTLNMTDIMYEKIISIGENPYSVNVITYSGHGISFGGEAIAVIPNRKSK